MSKKFVKILAGTTILIALLSAGFFYVNYGVKKELLQFLNTSPDNSYFFNNEEVKLNLFSGDLTIAKLKITLKDTSISQIKKLADRKRNLVLADINQLSLKKVKYWNLLFHHTLEIDSFILHNAKTDYYFSSKQNTDSASNAYEGLFNKTFNKVRINHFLIYSQQLNFHKVMEDSTQNFLSIDSFVSTTSSLIISPVTIRQRIPFSFKTFNIWGGKIAGETIFKKHTLKIKSLNYDAQTSNLYAKEISLTPKPFASSYRHENLAFIANEIIAKNFDIEKFSVDNQLLIKVLVFNNPVLSAEVFDNLPRPPNEKVKLTFHDLYKKLDFPMQIDTVKANNFKIDVKVHKNKDLGPAQIVFVQTNILGIELSTLKDSIGEVPNFNIYASSFFMNKALLKAHYRFFWNNKNQLYSLNGSLASCNLEIFNGFFPHLLYTKFTRGKLHQLTFDFTADNKQSKGVLHMDYEKMKIDVNASAFSKNKKDPSFLSGFANVFIKKNNLPSQNSYQIGEIDYSTNPYRSFFNNSYKSIGTGVVSIWLRNGKKEKSGDD